MYETDLTCEQPLVEVCEGYKDGSSEVIVHGLELEMVHLSSERVHLPNSGSTRAITGCLLANLARWVTR